MNTQDLVNKLSQMTEHKRRNDNYVRTRQVNNQLVKDTADEIDNMGEDYE